MYWKIILYSSISGLPIIIGGLFSSFLQEREFKLKSTINHWIVAFGGGALLSAITFALIPRASHVLSIHWSVILFLSSTVIFMMVDLLIEKVGSSLAQFISMLMDFLPEALVMGASFAADEKFGLVLALFIGLQNLPEGFNSYVELRSIMSKSRTLLLMLGLSFIGIIAALTGSYVLKDNMKLIGGILMFASAGILYLIFQDIAPMSKKTNDWLPATGASAGFIMGMVGEQLLSNNQ